MKCKGILSGALLSVVVLLASTALAADKAVLEISKAVSVNGHPLAAGKYTVSWEGSGPNVDLKVSKGKNLVITVPAQVVKQNTISSNDSVVVDKQPGGYVLTQIRPSGKKLSLVIGSETVQAAVDPSAK